MINNKKTSLLILSGSSNSGKTNTLKLLISNIINHYGLDINQYRSTTDYYIAKSWMKNPYQQMIQDNSDWMVFLSGVNGKSIAISTAGDTKIHVEESLSYIGQYDIIICATKAIKHTDSGSIATMQNYLRKNDELRIYPFYKLIYGSKQDSEKVKDDNQVLQSMFYLLENIIKSGL
ncbi:MAG: hypothetical protein RBQ71_02280 [Acholeplasmataceae bacterium]|jgi:hypothetical protein|nr:hypothetical protein [Acholeplasmataceae bacterium]